MRKKLLIAIGVILVCTACAVTNSRLESDVNPKIFDVEIDENTIRRAKEKARIG